MILFEYLYAYLHASLREVAIILSVAYAEKKKPFLCNTFNLIL